MSTQDNGGPAFPASHDAYQSTESHDGMTLRDYFAAKAMQVSMHEDDDDDDMVGAAKHAYAMADAMLKARNN